MSMKSYHLPNGMQIVAVKKPGVQTTCLLYWLKVGSIHESDEIRGVSHFLEHSVFKGSQNYKKGEFSRIVHSLGGDENAFTTFETTAFFTFIPKEHTDQALDMLTDLVFQPLIPEEEFEKEKMVVLEEIKMRLDQPRRYTWDMLRETAFLVHPYREEIKGSEETILNMKREQMYKYWSNYYGPENAIFVMVGDDEPETAYEKLAERSDIWTGRRTLTPPQAEPEPEQMCFRSRILTGDVAQTTLRLGFHIPPFKHYYNLPLNIMCRILSQGKSSRLYRALVQKGLAESVSVSSTLEGSYKGLLDFYAAFPFENHDAVITTLFAEMNRLIRDGISEQELSKVKNMMEMEYHLTNESPMELVFNLGNYIQMSRAEDYLNLVDRLRSVRTEDVVSAAEKCLTWNHCNFIIYSREENFKTNSERYFDPENMEERYREKIENPPVKAPERSAQRAEVKRKTLSNGGTLLVSPLKEADNDAFFSAFAGWRGGVAHEFKEKNGVSNMLCSVILRNRNENGKLLVEALESMGGRIFPIAAHDHLGFGMIGLNRFREECLHLFKDFLTQTKYRDEDVESVRTNILQSIAQDEDNLVTYTLQRFRALYYGAHPYGLMIKGTEETVPGITREDLSEHRKKICLPERMVVTVSGLSSTERAFRECDAIFGDLKGEANHFDVTLPSFEEPIPAVHSITRKKRQVNFALGFKGPSRKHQDFTAASVMNNMLSGMGNPLWEELREKRSLCYFVSGVLLADKNEGFIVVFMGTSPEKEKEALDSVKQALTDFIEKPSDDEELERAVNLMIGRHRRMMEQSIQRSSAYTASEVYDLGWEFTEKTEQRLRNISRDDIERVKNYLKPDEAHLVIVKPESTIL